MKGVNLSNRPPLLHSDSWVEEPAVIQASLAANNLIQVGGFTGIYGGKMGHCKVGRFCSIAPGCDIASDQHPLDWLSSSMIQYVPNVHGWGDWLKENGYEYKEPTSRYNSNSPVEIGNDVWIGQGVFIKSGVKIGDGAVIAAHSVVTKDIEAYSVNAGVPSRKIKYRFDDATVQRLISLKWWNYNVLSVPQLDFSNPIDSLDLLEELIDNGKIQPLELKKIKFE